MKSNFNRKAIVPRKTEASPELAVLASRSLIGGDGVVGKHREASTHSLVVLDGWERARGGVATYAGRSNDGSSGGSHPRRQLGMDKGCVEGGMRRGR